MALATSGQITYPDAYLSGYIGVVDVSTASATSGLTADTDKMAVVFQIPQIPTSETISVIGFRIGAVTSAADLTVGIYTVDSSGNPTGTAYGGMVAGTVASASVSAGAWVEATLGTPCTPVAAGDTVAIVITGASGVNVTLTYVPSAVINPAMQRYTAAAWGFKLGQMCVGVKWSGGTWGNIGTLPISARSYLTYASNTAVNDEVALKVAIPFACRCVGIWSAVRSAAGADFDAVLYNGTTSMASTSIDGDLYPSVFDYRLHYFATPQSLSAGTTYYAAIKPTTTTAILLPYLDVNAAAIWAAMPGLSSAAWSYRVDAGSWSDTATRRPMIGLIIDQLDDGAGAGGGLLTHPGMSGGISA